MIQQIIQIQTVDSCNAQCVKCPHSEIYHNRNTMDDEVFVKIIDEFNQQFGHLKTRVCLYLENEPLLDPLLFKRVKFIKQVIPTAELEISTNCLLLPKYEQQIMDGFDHIILSMQGWDCDSYNRIHKTAISEEKFDEMMAAFNRMKQNAKVDGKQFTKDLIEGDVDYNDTFSWYTMAYSRAGFLNNDFIYMDKLDGCASSKHKIINFLQDGSMILCCMDYLRKTVVGNIKYQSLKSILSSDLYNNMIAKVEGKIPSEKDFICKKCELSMGVKFEPGENCQRRPSLFKHYLGYNNIKQ